MFELPGSTSSITDPYKIVGADDSAELLLLDWNEFFLINFKNKSFMTLKEMAVFYGTVLGRTDRSKTSVKSERARMLV